MMTEIRRLTDPRDPLVRSAAALEKEALTTAFSAAQLEESLENGCFVYFVALDSDVLAGIAGFTCASGEAELINLAVAENKRRQGIATELLRFACSELRKLGGERLFLEVASRNVGAVRFYESLGFETVGRRKAFYRNPTDDALLMAKSI